MEREVFIWKRDFLPEIEYLESMDDYDGILIDNNLPDLEIIKWQKETAPKSGDLIHITFADLKHQKTWVEMTMSDTFNPFYYKALI
jgi:hypothetical protein